MQHNKILRFAQNDKDLDGQGDKGFWVVVFGLTTVAPF